MRRVVIAALLSVGFVLPAFAQDKPAQASPGPAPDRWDGFYAGLNLGYADSRDRGIDFNTWNTGTTPGLIGRSVRAARTGAVPPGVHTDVDGLFGGVQAGHNWRIYPEWVAGVEADVNAGNMDSKNSRHGFHRNAPFPPLLALSAIADVTGKQDVKWFSTLRGRLGMLATDDLFLYGTAGLTYSRLHASTTLRSSNCICGIESSASETDTKMGWTAGAGLEWAMDRNLSIKAEYLHLHLGNVSYRDSLTRFGLVSVINLKTDASFNTNIFRIGLNYRFGS